MLGMNEYGTVGSTPIALTGHAMLSSSTVIDQRKRYSSICASYARFVRARATELEPRRFGGSTQRGPGKELEHVGLRQSEKGTSTKEARKLGRGLERPLAPEDMLAQSGASPSMSSGRPPGGHTGGSNRTSAENSPPRAAW